MQRRTVPAREKARARGSPDPSIRNPQTHLHPTSLSCLALAIEPEFLSDEPPRDRVQERHAVLLERLPREVRVDLVDRAVGRAAVVAHPAEQGVRAGCAISGKQKRQGSLGVRERESKRTGNTSSGPGPGPKRPPPERTAPP